MNTNVTVFGCGPVGRETTRRLLSQGISVRVAQRRDPVELQQGAAFRACDVLDAEAVLKTMEGAQQIVVAIGFPYASDVWRFAWPRAMSNFVNACEATRARMVIVDNLYMYGPQSAPLREDMPLVLFGVKPAVRVEATRLWMAAAEAGRIRSTASAPRIFTGPASPYRSWAPMPSARSRTVSARCCWRRRTRRTISLMFPMWRVASSRYLRRPTTFMGMLGTYPARRRARPVKSLPLAPRRSIARFTFPRCRSQPCPSLVWRLPCFAK